jgi:hypothetical protein
MGALQSRQKEKKGTGATGGKVLYDLLEVRITGLEMPAAEPDVFVP